METHDEDVRDELAKYDNFDLEAYTQRRERETTGALRGDPMAKHPTSSSWVLWRVMIPNVIANCTIFALIVYEILAITGLFVVRVRTVMVVNGLMWVLGGLNMLLIFLLVCVGLVIKYDWNIGVLTSRFRGQRPVGAYD